MFRSFDLRIHRRGWPQFLLCIVGLILLSMFTAPVAYGIACGDEIRTSIKLTADLGPCPGNGLIIASPLDGAPNVTIDLNDHSILGSGANAGIWVIGGPGVIKSGRVSNFDAGIQIEAADVMVYDLQLFNNTSGIDIVKTQGVRVFDNTIVGHTAGLIGILTSDVKDTFIYRNTIHDISGPAVMTFQGISTVTENLIRDNNAGIMVAGVGGAVVRGNRIFNNRGNAIEVNFLERGSPCAIEDNDINRNAGNGVVVDGPHDCRVSNNLIRHSQLNGISITGGGDGHQVTGNRLVRNGIDLFWDGTSGACWRQNVFRTSVPATLPQCTGF